MALTALQLFNFIYTELGEPANSLVAAYFTGTGTNAITTTAKDNVYRLLSDAQGVVCRSCFLYQIAATLALTSPTSNQFLLSAFTPVPVGKFVFNFQFVTWTPTASSPIFLPETQWEALADFSPKVFVLPDTAVPTMWCKSPGGLPGIALDSIPSTNGTLNGTGYGIPADLTADGNTIAWLPDDRYRILVTWVCAMVIRKSNDPILIAKYEAMTREYDSIAISMRSEIDEDLAMGLLGPLLPFTPSQPGQPQQGDGE